MSKRTIENLTNIAKGFFSIINTPFWSNTSNEFQLILYLDNSLQTCLIRPIYFPKDSSSPLIKVNLDNPKNPPNYIITVYCDEPTIYILP